MLKKRAKLPSEIGRKNHTDNIYFMAKGCDFIMDIGNRILELRKNRNLSQESLAERVGVARQTISKWELGETSPDLKQAKKLSEIFGVSLDELACYHQPENEPEQAVCEKVNHTPTKTKSKRSTAKAVVICFLVFLLAFLMITTPIFVRMFIKKNLYYDGKEENIRYLSIECNLHGEQYFYEFRFYEDNGQIIEAGGDGYLADITEIEKYGNAYKAINIIDAYVKNNGGTTVINEAEIITEQNDKAGVS